MNEAQTKKLQAEADAKRQRVTDALRAFAGLGEHAETILEHLKEGSWHGQPSFETVCSPEFAEQFPAALHKPEIFAVYLDGRKSMVDMLLEDTEQALRNTNGRRNEQ